MSDPLARTYVWHGGIRYLVTTINRESSAALAAGMIYAETMAWEIDQSTNELVRLIDQGEAAEGSLRTHLEMVQWIFTHGPNGPKEPTP